MNTSNVVLKARVMPEWRKIFEAKDFDFGAIHRGQGRLEPADRGLVPLQTAEAAAAAGAPSFAYFAKGGYGNCLPFNDGIISSAFSF